MSLKNWDAASLFTAAEVYPPTDLDNADVSMTAVDLRGYGPGASFYALVTVLPNAATDTGMTFTVTDAATSGGQYATVAKSTSAVSTPGTTSENRHVLELAFAPTSGRPFVKIAGTKDGGGETDVTVQVHLIAYKQV